MSMRLPIAVALVALGAAPAAALDEPITRAADTFLDKGVLGAIIVVLAAVVAYREMYIRSLWTARLDDQKAFKAEIVAANKESTEGLARTAATTADLARNVETSNREGADRGRAFVEGLAPLVPIQTVLAGNASSLGRLEADVRTLVSKGARE